MLFLSTDIEHATRAISSMRGIKTSAKSNKSKKNLMQ